MGHDSTPAKAVIFDIGATLVTGPPVAPNKVIAGLIGKVSAADVASVIMTRPFESGRDVVAAIGAEFGPLNDDAKAGIEGLWESQMDAAVELEGATEAVLAVKSRGLKIGLLSDIWSPYYASVCRAIPEVIAAADAIVLSCHTGRRKPAPHNFIRVLADLGVGPDEAVMVGDTYQHDILPAIELGMRAVWVLARPDREAQSLVRVLNSKSPDPTQVVWRIGEIAQEVEKWTSSELSGIR